MKNACVGPKSTTNTILFALWGVSVTAIVYLRKKRKRDEFTVRILGDIFLDVVVSAPELPTWGCDLITDQPIQALAGGSALNTATHLSQSFSTKAVVWSAIGDDIWGSLIREHARNAGVKLKGMLKCISTAVCLVISGDNDRGFLTHRGPIASLALGTEENCIDDDMIISSLKSSDHLHVAGYYNCPNLWDEPIGKLFQKAKRKNIRTSLNCQYDSSNQWGHLNGGILPNCDFIFLNQDEALLISRLGLNDASQENIEKAAFWFLDRGVKVAVITLGAKGALAAMADNMIIVQCSCTSDRTIPLVDTTGAGDAFISGFLFAYHKALASSCCSTASGRGALETKAVSDGIMWGIAAGSCCIGQVGASTIMTLDQVTELLPNSSQLTIKTIEQYPVAVVAPT